MQHQRQSATVIPLPRMVLGWHFRTADQSEYPSRPLAGTLDPSQALAFVWQRPGSSTYEVAHRLGWSAKDAFDLCNGLARDNFLTWEMRACVRDGISGVTYCWTLSKWAAENFDMIARNGQEPA